MTDTPRPYRWRWFNWGLAVLFGTIWGFPYLFTDTQMAIYKLFDLDDLTGWLTPGTASYNLLRFLEITVAVSIAGGLTNLFLGPIWKNPVALTIDHHGLDHPMLFSRPLAWDEIASIEAAGLKPWRQIRVTLKHDKPPRHHRKGWLARLDRWTWKHEPPGPYSFTLSGWQINFKRDELAALMTRLKGAPDAPQTPPGEWEPHSC